MSLILKLKKYSLLTIPLIIVMIFSPLTIYANEIKPDLRWCHMANGGRNGPYCILSMNASYLSGNWATYFTDAKNEWINNSSSKISISIVSFSTSNVDLSTYNGSWPYVDCTAFTTIFDKNGNCYNGGITSNSIPLSSFGDRINMAGIIFNSNYANGSIDNLKKTIVHEIGHCVNLAHYSYPTVSVMRQGWDLEFTNYFRPQTRERTDLLNYYAILYN